MRDVREVTRRRLLAILLGLSLALAPPAAFLAWQLTRVEGSEACEVCGSVRSVDRRLFVTTVSAPVEAGWALEHGPRLADCPEHRWVKVGCWLTPDGSAYHAAPQSLFR